MTKDTTKKENIFQKAPKGPNDTGRIKNSNSLSAKTQLGGVKNPTKPTLAKENSQKSSKPVIYSFIKSENPARKPKGP